jgi:hypothetical protein
MSIRSCKSLEIRLIKPSILGDLEITASIWGKNHILPSIITPRTSISSTAIHQCHQFNKLNGPHITARGRGLSICIFQRSDQIYCCGTIRLNGPNPFEIADNPRCFLFHHTHIFKEVQCHINLKNEK